MVIGFVTEDYWRGGLAHFNCDLINQWPDKDAEFVICTNRENRALQEGVTRARTRFVYCDFRTPASGPGEHRGVWARVYRRSLFKYGFFPARYRTMQRLLAGCRADRWIISSGGYPGSDLCRLALLVLRGARGVFVFHGAMQKPWPCFAVLERLLDRLIFSGNRIQVVTVSHANAQTVSSRPWIGAEVRVIHNGILAGRAIVPKGALTGSRRIVAMCSGLRMYKGHEVIIRAAEVLKSEGMDIEVRFYGSDFDRFLAPLKARIAASRYPGIFSLPGYSAVNDIMAQADAVVVPSLRYESFGYTALEAMAYGVPVIVSDVGGLPEVVGDAAVVCKAGDTRSWVRALQSVLNDTSLREVHCARGLSRARDHFSLESMVDAYYTLLS